MGAAFCSRIVEPLASTRLAAAAELLARMGNSAGDKENSKEGSAARQQEHTWTARPARGSTAALVWSAFSAQVFAHLIFAVSQLCPSAVRGARGDFQAWRLRCMWTRKTACSHLIFAVSQLCPSAVRGARGAVQVWRLRCMWT